MQGQASGQFSIQEERMKNIMRIFTFVHAVQLRNHIVMALMLTLLATVRAAHPVEVVVVLCLTAGAGGLDEVLPRPM